jgi:prepilin-type N-terminal cleavage/methylation domain-containing protein
MRRQRGFSLIELLIVIAIILTIAAMAIPNLLRSKMSANEASAVGSIRTIATAETTYAVAYTNVGYADSLTKLAFPSAGQPVDQNHAALIDWVLGCANQPCNKAGYQFSIVNATGTPVSAYEITATPQLAGQTGRRGFCGDQVPRLMYDPNGGTSCTVPLE